MGQTGVLSGMYLAGIGSHDLYLSPELFMLVSSEA